MNQQLKNKCALVTGGSRGIGAAIVKRLASEGANVALTYSSSPDRANEVVKAAQASGVRAWFAPWPFRLTVPMPLP
jgi:3-oxoacyl-[acyl-carrier protein] reductase